jgi:hypothetical protein
MVQTITSSFGVFRTYLITVFSIKTILAQRPAFTSSRAADSRDIASLDFCASVSVSVMRFVGPVSFQFS